MAQWLSWLERRPVTAEVTGSSPVWVEISRRGGIGRRPGLKIPWVKLQRPLHDGPQAVNGLAHICIAADEVYFTCG